MLTIVSLQQRDRRAVPLVINNYHVNIAINNQVARTKIDQVFTNPNGFPVDGLYIFPVADDAVVSKLALSVDGKSVNGELLSSQEESYRIYRESARYGENKAILEHLGTRAFVVEVPGIPSYGKRRIEFEYSRVISADSDLAKYTYPLSLASASAPIRKLHIEMEIESEDELTVFSPSHQVTIKRKDDRHVRVTYDSTHVEPDDDFLCYYAVSDSDDDFGITLLKHRADENEDGYFMLLISPPKFEVKQIIEKDFIFVLDHSGSMAGGKVEQAKAALRYCVQNLNDGDKFNFILFNEDITSLADRLSRGEEWFGGERWSNTAALSDTLIEVKNGREEALAFIDRITANGLTNMNDALRIALAKTPDSDRPRTILFLTDGLPTVGVTNPALILENTAKANKNQSRIFVFGVGYDVNDHLLNQMAADNGGTVSYVVPDEDIEDAICSLFRKINEPVLVGVGINFGRQIVTKELTPKNLPDLFRGDQLTLLGRYEGHGDTVLQLGGIIGGEWREFSKDVHFSALEPGNDFLPHLWVESRISELVGEAALDGGNEELFDEIERLSKKHGVETPYTSFKLADDGSLRRLYDSRIFDAYTEARPISDRIRDHRGLEEQKYARYVRQYADTRRMGRKAFYRHGNVWVDVEYDGQSERKEIAFGSEDYYELMNRLPDLAKYSKLAKSAFSMIICHEGVNYEITPPTV